MIFRWVKKIFLTTCEMYLPAILFSIGVFFYFNKSTSFTVEPNVFHFLFYGFLISFFSVLLILKKPKDFFWLLLLFLLYVGLNTLKKNFGLSYTETDYFALLGILIPINWFCYLVFDYLKLSEKYYIYFLCLLLIEGAIIENYSLLFDGKYYGILSLIALILWFVSILAYIFYVSFVSGIRNYGMFFSYLCLCMGFYNGESEFALSLYFSLAVLIFFITTIYSEIYCYFKDALTAVYSHNTYLRHSKNFSLKYSMGIICVDDYAKLVKVFGNRQVDKLMRMLVEKIKQFSSGADIYRSTDDEFILIFNNEDKKKSYEYLENIRRSIAGSEFVLSSTRIVKVTISSGVTEKKRSDADADDVMMRIREAFQRTYKFTQNMTTLA